MGAMQYTDEMLEKLQYIIEHSIKDNKEKYNSLLTDLEKVLTVVNNNRNELRADNSDNTSDNILSDSKTEGEYDSDNDDNDSNASEDDETQE